MTEMVRNIILEIKQTNNTLKHKPKKPHQTKPLGKGGTHLQALLQGAAEALAARLMVRASPSRSRGRHHRSHGLEDPPK